MCLHTKCVNTVKSITTMFGIQKSMKLMGSFVIEHKRGISCAVMSTNKLWTTVDSNATKRNDLFKGSCTKPRIRSSPVRPQSTGNSVPTDGIAALDHVTSDDEMRAFSVVFPDVVRDLTESDEYLDIPEATKWFAEVLEYNVPTGKKYRGWATVLAYRILTPADQLTPENLRLARILGWCVEMLETFTLVIDDVIDNSTTRRCRPCWYHHKGIGLAAINDAILIENGLYELIKRYFQDKPYYTAILELFHDVTFKTALGEYLDLSASEFGRKPNFDNFTMTRFTAIAKYKTAYFSYYLPVALALHMAGFQDEEMHRQAETVALEIGHFLQVQDDFLDCFGDYDKTGKIGSDIQNGKCTWLVVVALQRVSPEQRTMLEAYYGSKNPEHVAAVKELYKLIGIPAAYSKFEEENYKLINTHIQQMSQGMPRQWFITCLEKIYRRTY